MKFSNLKIVIWLCLFLISSTVFATTNHSYPKGNKTNNVAIESGNSKIELKTEVRNNQLQYQISFNDTVLIDWSGLGLVAEDVDLVPSIVAQTNTNTVKEEWTPLFGKSSLIHNNYREACIQTKTNDSLNLNVFFRVFDDGVALRYEIPKQDGLDSLVIIGDKTSFNFADDFICRGIDANVETSEFLPEPISQRKFSKLPLLVQTPYCWMAINEASVFDFSMMYLRNNSGKPVMNADIGTSPCKLPFKTPWRVIQIGEKPGSLIESNILVNLNEPCKIEDTSWIKPGKAFWDWRNHGDTINGFVYGINEASYKRLIDFASKDSFQYVLFDADWYSEKGPQYPREDLDMQAIIQYAKNKNVSILLYIDRKRKGDHNDWEIEDVLKTFHDWGAAGIKYGFLAKEIRGRKTFVDVTRKITRLCAKYQLLVDFHDNPVHPGGEERTWPNRIAVEYCHAQQDSRKSFSPSKSVTVPFVNGLSGPLDMANGYYDLNGLQNRTKVDKNGLNSTVVGETARCLVNYTPLLVLPDNGDEYSKKADLFEFIREMPDTWDQSIVVDGTPGKFIIIARRSGKNWFVGSLTNEEGRKLDLDFSFLSEGQFYQATFYEDADDSHYLDNKESYKIRMKKVNQSSNIRVKLAPGGGHAIWLQYEKSNVKIN